MKGEVLKNPMNLAHLQHDLRSHQAKGAAWQPAQPFSRQPMAQEGSQRMSSVSGW